MLPESIPAQSSLILNQTFAAKPTYTSLFAGNILDTNGL
jgi:hypothetical protein